MVSFCGCYFLIVVFVCFGLFVSFRLRFDLFLLFCVGLIWVGFGYGFGDCCLFFLLVVCGMVICFVCVGFCIITLFYWFVLF